MQLYPSRHVSLRHQDQQFIFSHDCMTNNQRITIYDYITHSLLPIYFYKSCFKNLIWHLNLNAYKLDIHRIYPPDLLAGDTSTSNIGMYTCLTVCLSGWASVERCLTRSYMPPFVMKVISKTSVLNLTANYRIMLICKRRLPYQCEPSK